MKKTYRVSDMGLEPNPEVELSLKWLENEFVMELGKLWDRMAKGKSFKFHPPVRAELTDGRKVGIFATITAKTERAAGALSILHGAPIAVGDGWTFNRQSLAERELCILVDNGISLEEVAAQWMIGRHVGPAQMELPLASAQPSYEEQLQDSPF